MVPIHIMVLVWVADCRTAWGEGGGDRVRIVEDNDEFEDAPDLECQGEVSGSLLLAQLLAGLGQGGEEHVVPGG